MPEPKKTTPKKPANVIFRPWRKDPKTGKILWAKSYGLKAWAIPVDDKKSA